MLPPVSPVTATDVSFSMSKPPQDAASQPPAPPAAAPAEPAEAVNLVSNTGIRAVSGEFQLSNNVGVLAETLGKLLNIARMDGEAAEAYVNRLVESIKSLPADQKAALEKALGSVLRGISLDMLSNALKSSAGPEAARLAVMFELSRSSGTSRTPKPSISDYLQDILPDSPVIPQIKTQTAALAPASAGTKMIVPQPSVATNLSGNVRPDQAVTQPSISPQPSKTDPILTALNPPTVSAGTNISQTTPISAPTAQGQQPALPVTQAPQPMGLPSGPTQTANAIPVPAVLDETALATRPQMTEQQRAALVAQQLPLSDMDMAAENPRQMPMPVANFAVPPLSALTAGALAKATPKEMENLLLAVLLGKLPEQAGNITPQIIASVLTAQNREQMAKPLPAHKADPHSGSAPDTDDETVLAAQRQDVLAAQRNAVAQDIKAALLEQPMLHSALAAIVAKEAIPLPYVAYPAAKDEDESDAPTRGSMHSSQGDSEDADDDGEQGEQESSQEERTAANDEISDQSLSEGENNDGATDNAESYYLRMGGYS